MTIRRRSRYSHMPLERHDGTLEITATVVDSAMLEWWLRGFGKAVNSVSKTRPNSERPPK
jgi:hypothetical protein